MVVVVEVAVIVRVVTLYVRGGEDTDDGALAGSRADERQQLIAVRSRALAGNVALVAALAGFAIAVAVRSPWWPFAVMFLVTGFGYLLTPQNTRRQNFGSGRSSIRWRNVSLGLGLWMHKPSPPGIRHSPEQGPQQWRQ
jgi:hypothetical protein